MKMTTVKICQLRSDVPNYGDLYTNNLAYLQRIINFEDVRNIKDFYKVVYKFEDNFENMSIEDIQDTISNRFTLKELPDDFQGHRLNISDLIIIDNTIYFKDSYGLQEVGTDDSNYLDIGR